MTAAIRPDDVTDAEIEENTVGARYCSDALGELDNEYSYPSISRARCAAAINARRGGR